MTGDAGAVDGGGRRLAGWIATAAFAVFAALVLFAAAGPFKTADGWFHLGAGELYAREGPWPAGDAMLFTAHADAPVQHEWLFGVASYAIEAVGGFHGLRVLHALLVALTLALAWSAFRRASGERAAAALAGCVFLLLAWYRFWQFRPDLVSIPATLLAYRLLLEQGAEPPPWRRVAAFALLVLVWANVHSLFAVALLLVGAAAVGQLARGLAARRAGEAGAPAFRCAGRLAAAVGLGFLAALLNPRGLEQVLTFVTSTRASRLWSIRDEWTPFVPWEPARYGHELGLPVIAGASILLVVFAVAALVLALRAFARTTPERLRAADPVLLALGVAGAVAMCASIRFLWLGFFPLLFLLHAASGARRGALASAASALLAIVVCASFATSAAWRAIRPPTARYLSLGYSLDAWPMAASVRFLQDARLEGRLACDYTSGGFVGYWLAPRLRTLIDGRVEHYDAEVFDDYIAVRNQVVERAGASFLERLDARGAELYLGHVLPIGTGPDESLAIPYASLDGVPGWVPVFRSYDGGVYLRLSEANGANLARLVRWFEEQGVPFDAQRGLDMDAVVRERPDWAIARRALPADHAELLAGLEDSDAKTRYRALHRLGLAYALIGAWEESTAMDRRALALVPTERGPRRRLIYGLVALDRLDEAERELAALEAQEPGDRWLILFRSAVDLVRFAQPGGEWTTPLGRRLVLNRMPLFDQGEYVEAIAGRYVEVWPAPREGPHSSQPT